MTAKEERAAISAFLTAAEAGDITAVDAYIRGGGDVNATLGGRWTALHWAVTRGQLVVIDRLLQEKAIDLNALTIVDVSALRMAIRLQNNVVVARLLDGGASRATVRTLRFLLCHCVYSDKDSPFAVVLTFIRCLLLSAQAREQLHEAWDSSWIWPEVRRRLDPTWSIVWTPRNLHRFSSQEQEKFRLVLLMNHSSGSHNRGWASQPNLSLAKRVRLSVQHITDAAQEQNDVARSASAACVMLGRVWRSVVGEECSEDGATKRRADSTSKSTDRESRWQYLPPAVLQLVLQYALFLW